MDVRRHRSRHLRATVLRSASPKFLRKVFSSHDQVANYIIASRSLRAIVSNCDAHQLYGYYIIKSRKWKTEKSTVGRGTCDGRLTYQRSPCSLRHRLRIGSEPLRCPMIPHVCSTAPPHLPLTSPPHLCVHTISKVLKACSG